MPINSNDIGKKLLNKRHQARMNQTQVAKIIGTDQCVVSWWENSRHMPHPKMMPKILDFLGMDEKALKLFAAKLKTQG